MPSDLPFGTSHNRNQVARLGPPLAVVSFHHDGFSMMYLHDEHLMELPLNQCVKPQIKTEGNQNISKASLFQDSDNQCAQGEAPT